jgi:hypothetical protein
VAALIKQRLEIDPELVEGSRGEFTIWVGEQVVAKKGMWGFPEENEVVTAVQRALEAA